MGCASLAACCMRAWLTQTPASAGSCAASTPLGDGSGSPSRRSSNGSNAQPFCDSALASRAPHVSPTPRCCSCCSHSTSSVSSSSDECTSATRAAAWRSAPMTESGTHTPAAASAGSTAAGSEGAAAKSSARTSPRCAASRPTGRVATRRADDIAARLEQPDRSTQLAPSRRADGPFARRTRTQRLPAERRRQRANTKLLACKMSEPRLGRKRAQIDEQCHVELQRGEERCPPLCERVGVEVDLAARELGAAQGDNHDAAWRGQRRECAGGRGKGAADARPRERVNLAQCRLKNKVQVGIWSRRAEEGLGEAPRVRVQLGSVCAGRARAIDPHVERARDGGDGARADARVVEARGLCAQRRAEEALARRHGCGGGGGGGGHECRVCGRGFDGSAVRAVRAMRSLMRRAVASREEERAREAVGVAVADGAHDQLERARRAHAVRHAAQLGTQRRRRRSRSGQRRVGQRVALRMRSHVPPLAPQPPIARICLLHGVASVVQKANPLDGQSEHMAGRGREQR
eukprot:2438629-Pleurochrysis_carterae.AAC.1